MAAVRTLAALKVGALVLLPCRLTAKSAAGVTLEPQAKTGDTWSSTGAFSIAAAGGAVTGAWTTDPREQPVRVVAFAITPGDVMFNQVSGRTVVARAVGLGPEGSLWSSDPSGRETYTADDWTPVGFVDPASL